MPLSASFAESAVIERIERIRHAPALGHGIAVLTVAVAALARWAISPLVPESVTFLTFYPAIIVAAAFGGFGAGLLAIVLSTLAAWFFFVPPGFSFQTQKLELWVPISFIMIGLINAGLVGILNMIIERLASNERNIRTLIEAAPNGILVVDRDGVIRLANASLEKLFGYSREELIGRSVETLLPEQVSEAHQPERTGYLQNLTPRAMGAGRDVKGRRKDGEEFPVEIGLAPVRRSGKEAVLATVVDISERKRAQAQQKLLMRELEHRTSNVLSVVTSIAEHTLQEGTLTVEAKKAFLNRVNALARAQRLVARAAWQQASLSELFKQELSGFSHEHISLKGDELTVNSPAAQQFALIVHELATNASKHGALSKTEGRVSVEWLVDRTNGEPMFSFCWKEKGGPPVRTPSRNGFGSAILLRAAKQFGLEVALSYDPDGLKYELSVPLEKIEGCLSEANSAAQEV